MTQNMRLKLFACMQTIRSVEEEIARRYSEGRMRCPTHLSVGQESIPGIFSLLVKQNDYAVSTHRGHAHYLAKGGNLNAMIAELFGKVTGCSGGKGGSMHLADRSANFMGTSAIVGNSIPVGVGLGLAASLRRTQQVSCIFLGDGAVEEGVFYESVNFASLKNLPVMFICENNLYSVYSNLAVRQPQGRIIADMVTGMGMASKRADGENLEEAFQVMAEAFENVRNGHGPVFLEFSTYRWREHCGPNYDNELGYRDVKEFELRQSKDPLVALEDCLRDEIADSGSAIKLVRQEIAEKVKRAFELAEQAEFPDPEAAFTGVYA